MLVVLNCRNGRVVYETFAKSFIRLGSHLTAYSSGPNGVDRRTPVIASLNDTSIAITDPFILYQNYISQGLLEKDEHQLRAMKEFQKLYHRLIDYKPPEDLQIKISLLLRKIEVKQSKSKYREMNKSFPMKLGHLSSYFVQDPEIEKQELIKYITDEEELRNFNSPQGLLVNGEVGCGKSMLMDIFASSLPHSSKMRWHFNNFMLWVFNEIHKIQKEKILTSTMNNQLQKISMENEFILFEIAQKMINKNTVLMLDEFMLPDIASANIIKILFTYYFKLGGVLVATSNKLPEELYSNEFHKSKFKSFVNVLNYRCKPIDMRSAKDYRVEHSILNENDQYYVSKYENPLHFQQWTNMIKTSVLKIDPKSPLMSPDILLENPLLGGKPAELKVYNRITKLPLTFDNKIVYLDFQYICGGLFGSSDYITLASNYKTVILYNVPILTTKMKNEARRFITLLDAIYESKCQFYIHTEVPINYLFFPDSVESSAPPEIKNLAFDKVSNNLEVQNEEMFAKTRIAIDMPYRPNVSTYDQQHTAEYKENTDLQTNDFTDLKAFTGEDEKFAYKRAVSRIKEMTGSIRWREQDRWVPMDHSMRPWETTQENQWDKVQHNNSELTIDCSPIRNIITDKDTLKSQLPRDLSVQYNIPFRQFNRLISPVFTNVQHFWSLGQWNLNYKKLKDEIAKSWINSSKR